jgi:hypothetical protein
VPVLEGGGNSAVELDTQEDGDCAEVTEAARAGFEKAWVKSCRVLRWCARIGITCFIVGARGGVKTR